MEDLNNYDKAAQDFYGKLRLNTFPINSLDWYGLHFDRMARGGNDIKVLDALATKYRWRSRPELRHALFNEAQVIVVTDTDLNIVHATNNMSEMNGYSLDEVMGKSPKMFQGADTCRQTLNYISESVREHRPFEAVILNYRKDGTPYKCWIKGEPLYNKKGQVVHFIAYEKEVA